VENNVLMISENPGAVPVKNKQEEHWTSYKFTSFDIGLCAIAY